jgi:hypothetical protein
LDARGERKIALQSPLFLTREVIEAEAKERINSQAVRFDGIVARFADSKAPLFKAVQSGVHGRQQLRKRSIGAGGM